MNYNRVIIGGHLTRDVELRSIGSGTAVAKFGVACNRKWRDTSGETREDVLFVDVEAWGKTAETISRHFTKGKPILIEGRLKLETWDDKQTGAKRSKHLIVCDSFVFVGAKEDGQAPAKAAAAAMPTRGPSTPEDDIPFALSCGLFM